MSGKSNEHHPKPYCQEAGRLDGHWHGRRLAGAIPRYYLGYSEERQPGTVHLADDSGTSDSGEVRSRELYVLPRWFVER
jgi:hypothetical protein